MASQEAPCYPAAGASSGFGPPGFYSRPDPGLNVPVGIPAGLHGSVARSGNAVPGGPPLVAVGNGVPGNGHLHMGSLVVGNSHVGNFPVLPAHNLRSHIAQAQQQSSFAQPSGSDHAHESPSLANSHGQWQGHPAHPPSAPSPSCPPGFEPRHSNNIATGIPSQPNLVNGATGGGVVHVDRHQLQQQHHSQIECQHFQGQPPHHRHRPQGQKPSSLHQHQNFRARPPHQHQHQYQQHSPHQNQCQKQYQQHNQHHHQHRFQHQQNTQHEYQQQQQQQHQHEHQRYQHLHSQSQLYLQTQHQPHPQPQHESQPHHHLQPQPQSQPHPACQQVQPLVQSHQPTFQTCTVNGIAIGVPVRPTQNNVDAISAQTLVYNQQPTPAWQHQSHPENSSSTPQLKSTFLAMNHMQDQCSSVVSSQGEFYPNRQQSTNFRRAGELHSKDPSHEEVWSRSSSRQTLHSDPEGMEPADAPRSDHMQMNGHMTSGTNCHNSIRSKNQDWQSPPRAQFRSRARAGNQSHGSRSSQHHFNRPFAESWQKTSDDSLLSQRQKRDLRGNPFSKCVGKRSDIHPLRCEPCDRTFTTSQILANHLKSHVKCGEEGCSFEAAGKVVKEHRVVKHGKVDFQSTYRGRKALAMRSMEDKEDIERWREERKRSYPTAGNILRKAEEKRKREGEGESIDEEAQLRRQRMLNIIAKQRQLGFEPPEIPSHYFRTLKKSRKDSNGSPAVRKEIVIAKAANGKGGSEGTEDASGMLEDRLSLRTNAQLENGSQDVEASSHDRKSGNENQYHRNGRFKKGRHNKFLSSQDRRRLQQHSHARNAWWQHQPSLLSKLLRKDIEAENSQLLQCCRFIVNNAFLQDCSVTSLKHFDWIEATMCASASGQLEKVMDAKAQLKLEEEEEVSVSSDSEYSACGLELHQRTETTKKIIENVVSDTVDVTCIKFDNAADAFGHLRKENENQEFNKAERNELQLCHPMSAAEVGPNAKSILPPPSGGSPNNLVDSKENHSTGNNIIGVKISQSTSTPLSSQDLEAGEVASGNSKSVVEDKEDTSKSMDLDVGGVDSGF